MMNNMVSWSPGMTLDTMERLVIEAAFRHFMQNKTQTANALGIAIRTLDSKLEKYSKYRVVDQEREDHARRERDAFLARSRGRNTPNYLSTGSDTADAAARQRTFNAASGTPMESLANASTQPAMPMPERKEVQGVLPGKAPARSPRRPG